MNENHPPLLSIERIKFLKKIESKKCIFDTLAELLAKGQSEVTKDQVFDALISREKLGNTTLGNGIAIPRAHLDISRPRAALLILKKGINLNSADKIDVRIFLAILVPNNNIAFYEKFIHEINKLLITDNKYHHKNLDGTISTKNRELVMSLFESLFDKAFNILNP